MKVSPHELKAMALFATCTPETLTALGQSLCLETYPKGTVLFSDKQALERIYITYSGKFCIYKLTANNDRRIIFIKDTGTLLNDSIEPSKLSVIDCESFSEAQVLSISKQAFLNLMQQDFNLTLAVLNQYSGKLRKSYRQLKNALTTVSVDKKIVAKLYALCRDFGRDIPEGVLIDMPLTVTHLSEMLGAQRETVSRLLKKLAQEQLLDYQNKRLVVYDLEKMVQFYNK